ncbi:MAG: response regulator [Alphaproteobacteria bacterium]|nr:response regulator [Alphaproteobacteria bacterium]
MPARERVIAIVDDDQPLRDALQRMLISYGFQVLNFPSARALLDLQAFDRIGCMILDIRMPEMSGMALHEHLIASGHIIPTILITALPTRSERERAGANGAISYLAKPVSERILLDTIHAALEHEGVGARKTVTGRVVPGI